ncbi:MAG TPA: DUF416 family protein [Mycobacterium sp.]|uniref:DUF416 family protein n=1 Tax=Mycobacterium sp. TaxID=1785 RepID=UPI002D610E13|nr:DUF416 family protein [Mycobacterium sp.]HZU46834.1 DUF416 family protein [Mycobacterium sp.]
MVLRFNHANLLAVFERFSRWQLALFSAASTEFLVPSYRLFSNIEDIGDPQRVEGTLERAWAYVNLGIEEINPSLLPGDEEILSLLPGREDWNEWSLCAEYAVASLAALVRVW